MYNFDEASQKGREVMDGMLKSYADMAKAFQAIADEATEYSKKSCMEGVAHFEALTSVKSPEQVLDLQMSFMRNAYEGMVSQLSRMGDMYVDLASTAYRPFEARVVKKPAAKPAPAVKAAAAPETVPAAAETPAVSAA